MSKFQEYSTSTAFFVKLSKRQIEVLLHMSEGSKDYVFSYSHYHSTLASLYEKGLAEFRDGKGGQITKAGSLMAELLKEAGFSVQVSEAA